MDNIEPPERKSILKLPQIIIHFPSVLPPQSHLIVSGGRAPAVSWLKETAKGKEIWAVDHGVDVLKKSGLSPDHLLGDNDSAQPLGWNWGKAHADTVACYPRAKDLTDTQIALEKISGHSFLSAAREAASKKGPLKKTREAFLLLTGAFGGRLDHLYNTIFSASRLLPPCRILLADEQELLLFLHDGDTFTLTLNKIPSAISLLPMTCCVHGVSTHGLRWSLKNAELTQSFPNATSNELLPGISEFSVATTKGILGLYLYWQELRQD